MAITFENCWIKLRDFFPELDWSNLRSNNAAECDIKISMSSRLQIKLGKTENGISCKILILQGNKLSMAEDTRILLLRTDIPNDLTFYHGGNSKSVYNVCNSVANIMPANGEPIYIGFIHAVDMTEEVVPFGEDDTVKQALKTRIEKLTEFIRICFAQ